MGTFPQKVTEIKQQCHDMIIGYSEHPEIFTRATVTDVQLVYTELNSTGDA